MERFDREPESERVQWIALAIHDDWGGEFVREALTTLLAGEGFIVGAAKDKPNGDPRDELNRLVGRGC